MQKMGKRGRPLRKHSPRDQPSVRNLRPRGKQISPHRIQSEIPQDESLPTERSLQSKLMQRKCEIGLKM
jgi:hypothetical protein